MSQKIKKKFIEDVIFTDITSEIDGKVAAEEAARIMGDSDLQDAVDAEEAARVAADSNLQSQIDGNDADIAALQSDLANLSGAGGFATDAELQAAVDALQADIDQNELDADTAIAAEETRALAAEANLQGQIDAEVSRATAAEAANATAISDEEAARIAADGTLQANIDIETARIDAILDASTADKDSFAEIVALINSVDTENDNAFAGYVTSNDAALAAEVLARETLEGEYDAYVISNDAALAAEVLARETLEGEYDAYVISNDAALAQEVADRVAADDVLQANITAEEAARIAADDALRGDLVDATYSTIEQLDDAVVALEAASSTGIGGVQAELDATQAGAGLDVDGSYLPNTGSNYISTAASLSQADSLLDVFIKQNADDIAQEEADRIAADGMLQANIDIETARIDAILDASTADKDSFAEIVALINSVDTENDNAFAAYVLSNDNALAQEVADRIAADNTLQANIDAEEARALAAEGVLQTNIDQESMDRFAADEVLQGNIDAEAATREAADTALDVRVTTLEGEMDSAEGRLDALEAVAWVKEKFELVQADIDNGFITLSQSPVSGSESVFVGRLAMHEGAAEDYQVSGSQITFLNDLVGTGNQKLQVGDVVYVKYQA